MQMVAAASVGNTLTALQKLCSACFCVFLCELHCCGQSAKAAAEWPVRQKKHLQGTPPKISRPNTRPNSPTTSASLRITDQTPKTWQLGFVASACCNSSNHRLPNIHRLPRPTKEAWPLARLKQERHSHSDRNHSNQAFPTSSTWRPQTSRTPRLRSSPSRLGRRRRRLSAPSPPHPLPRPPRGPAPLRLARRIPTMPTSATCRSKFSAGCESLSHR